jgi:hypothetical protein
MAKKKSGGIDFKQVLVQKGERYGFYLAGALLLLFLFLGGYKAATSASASSLVTQFDQGVQKVNQRIAQKPSSDEPSPIPPIAYKDPTVATIPFTEYVVRHDMYDTTRNEQVKRVNPLLYPPFEAQVDFVRGPIAIYDIRFNDKGEKQIGIVRERPKTANDRQKTIPKRVKKGGMNPAAAPQPAPGAPAGGPPIRPGVPGVPGMQAQNTELKIEYVNVDDPAVDSAQPAEDLDPRRMVVVTLAIPYKLQVEEYRRALRASSKNELSEFPEYRGFIVERRVVSQNGKPVDQDWAVLDVKGTTAELFGRTIEFEPETPPQDVPAELKPLFQRLLPEQSFELLLPRPKFYRSEYPAITMPSILKALKALAATGQTVTEVHTQTRQRIDDNNPFNRGADANQGNNPGGGVGRGPGGGGPAGGMRLPPGMRTLPQGPAAPGQNNPQGAVRAEDEEAWLMRFIDVTVEPGYTYQYRVSLKALNPNFKHTPANELAVPDLAKKEFLQSAPYEVPTTVSVPPEEYLYAAAQKPSRMTEKMPSPGLWDDTWMQFQKWGMHVTTIESGRPVPFGEWIVADIKAIRGQYIADRAGVTLPLWDAAKAMFLLRENAAKVRPVSAVMVGPRPKAEPTWTLDLEPKPQTILVDFEGGDGNYIGPKRNAVRDAPGVEMLLLTADGKLRVARSGPDLTDADRVKREDGWNNWVTKVKQDSDADKSRDNPAGPAGPGRRPGGPGQP